ncbi:MAG: AsmA-like C-terminal region-containing protein, partial [Nitrospinaceae bacterium]
REPIMKELSRSTNLSIEIESLNLSLFNGLRLQGSGLKVSSKDGVNKIFSAQNLVIDAELKSLLAGQLKIKKILLVKPIINITFDSKVVSSNLLNISKKIDTKFQKNILKPNDVVKQKALKTKTPEISLLESIRNLLKEQSLSLRSITIKKGEFIFSKPDGDKPFLIITPIFLNAQLDISNPTSSQINIKGKLSHIVAGALKFKGTIEALDVLEGLSPVKVNIESTSFALNDLYSLINAEAIPNSVIIKSGKIEKIFINVEGLISTSQN